MLATSTMDTPIPQLLGDQVKLCVAEVASIGDAVFVQSERGRFCVEVGVLDYQPAVGDRVLVLGDETCGYFVVGVLATITPRPRLDVRYDPERRVTTVRAESGDLELLAPQGAVRLLSATGIEATCAGPIQLRSRNAIHLAIADRLGNALHRLGISRRNVSIAHEQVDVSADRLGIASHRCSLKAEDAAADVGTVSLQAQRARLKLGTLISHVENAYQTVAGLWQLVADRTRTVVQGTSHHKAARIYSKADDVKVKADKIHLG